MPRRLVQLVLSCVVLGTGVALALNARLGSDGYSTLLNGLTIKSCWSFLAVSLVIAAVLIGAAWLKGQPPGIGTLVQAVVVPATISALMPVFPHPTGTTSQWALFLLGFVVLCVGIAGYVATDLGVGPTESLSVALDPPVPFRWSYTIVQVTSGAIGWWGGADVGWGTLLVVLGIGPIVDRMLPGFERLAGISRAAAD